MFSPKEQYIIFPVFNVNIVINNVIFYLLIAASLVIILGNISNNKIITNNWGILSESLFRTILLKIENFVGPKYTKYLPLFYTIFHLVLFSNLIGLVPYTSTPTVELIMTLSIAFTLLIGKTK
jgi:F0F1-type ATP synthase membrane subunit a